MRIGYCDCFSGISGDMFLAALLDAGLRLSHVNEQIDLLHLPEGPRVVLSETHKQSLRASAVEVVTAEHAHAHHRHLSDILSLIESSDLPASVKKQAEDIFRLLAKAEARVHGASEEDVHFHEVGAVDSIVDIVGAAVGVQSLGISRLFSSPLPYGTGQVQTQHGTLPLPAPATLEIVRLAHIPLAPSPAQVETVTPTGAAIVAALATFDRPPLAVTAVGVGAGKRDLPWPNIMRLIIGDADPDVNTQMVLIETNIDDMNPQVYGHVMTRLFEAGALDVYLTPVYMKKNRPGIVLAVIARRSDEPDLARLILEETSTLGLRVQPLRRYEAERSVVGVQTRFGEIPLKLKLIDGKAVQATPEYDVCVRLAAEHKAPLREVLAAGAEAAAELLHGAKPAAT
jgi:uncharacterized protein (TIGR00299 family) protein